MNALNDPRRGFYFIPLDNGNFVGGMYGFTNTYANYSKINPTTYALDFEALLLDYSELEFLLAEAVERNFLTGTAAEHYNNLLQPAVAYATAAGDFKQKINT